MTDNHVDYLGTPHFPISALYLRAALELLTAGWILLRSKGTALRHLHEDNITAFLSDQMKTAQRSGISDIIMWDPQVGTQSNPNDPQEMLKIDIKFRWDEYPTDNDRYLAAEAKRLRGKGTSLAGKYVEEGIMRFVTARYGRGHDRGIMMGYVIVPPIDQACTRVTHAMHKRRSLTKEKAPLHKNGAFCNYPFTYHSEHIQGETNVEVTLVHLFLDAS
ncbi:MAG: hypothetical protein ACYDHZ_01130 [Dehalococcoidia bacterium]